MKLKALAIILLIAGFSFAATCASRAYSASCMKCPFDTQGKMDQKCYESIQGSGVSCLFAAYPVESISYQMGNCPAVDACRERLETCKAIYSSGNDKLDCDAENVNHCFARADSCVAYAVKHCNESPPGDVESLAPPAAFCDGFFFFIIPLFAGAAFFGRN